MAEISYESIEPLIASAEEDGQELVVRFVCPLTDKVYEGVGRLERGHTLADVTRDEGVSDWLRRSLGSLVHRTLSPTVSSARAEAGGKALAQSAVRTRSGQPSPYTEEERKAAAVRAFQSVSHRFLWHEKGRRWIAVEGAGELLSAFARQLEAAPVTVPDDRQLLARMLVEVARADGKVTPAEWCFLGEHIPGDTCSVDTSMELPDLTADELDEAGLGASRETMLMLSWALALTDEELDGDETERLLGYARGLRIPEARALELRGYAREYLLVDAFRRAYPRGKPKPAALQEAHALGERLGMDAAEVAACEDRFKRRRGYA